MLLYMIYNPTNIRNVYFYCVFYIKLCSHNCFILVKVFPLLQVCFISPFFLCYYFIFQLEEVVWEVPHLLRVYSRSESGLLCFTSRQLDHTAGLVVYHTLERLRTS